jgi:uncharacterized protein (TIGR03435 family)
MLLRCATFLRCAEVKLVKVLSCLWVTAGSLTTVPRVNAQATAQFSTAAKNPSFEVVAIKPSKLDSESHVWTQSIDRVLIQNYSLRQIIRVAYDAKSDSQIVGGPKWIDKQPYDIVAKMDDAEIAKMRNLSNKERHAEQCLVMQSLLAERFRIQVSRGQRTLPVYALVVGKSGSKLTSSLGPTEKGSSPASDKPTTGRQHTILVNNGHMAATGVSMDDLADDLTGMRESGERVVLNLTGLTGEYDFTLNWAEDRGEGVPADATYPGLFTALQEQLGLKMESQKGSVDVIVVETATEAVLD